METETTIPSLASTERAAIVAALRHFNGNRTYAARALVISIRTLQRKLKADPSIEQEVLASHDAVTDCRNVAAC